MATDNVTLPITDPGLVGTITGGPVTDVPPPESGYQRDLKTSIIAMSIVVGIVVTIVLAIWIIWWKLCKSPRSRHGNERVGTNSTERGKKQYYDQFCVNDHQLTVNSVTAIKWEDEERGSNKSSGIDCDSHSSEFREEHKVVTGKRVFSVNKVQEKPSAPNVKTPNGGSVVIKLPRQYADITRSLQAGDGKNYTLAIIDKHSQTVHNIDLRNYRLRRSVSPNAAVSSSGAQSRIHHHHHPHPRRHRHRSEGHSRSSGAQSAAEMIHDSPDFNAARRKKPVVTESADEVMTTRSLTDFSASSDSAGQRRSDSLSSHDEESSKELLPNSSNKSATPSEAHEAVTSDSEKENLLDDYQ